jgi:hypothetical protein
MYIVETYMYHSEYNEIIYFFPSICCIFSFQILSYFAFARSFFSYLLNENAIFNWISSMEKMEDKDKHI